MDQNPKLVRTMRRWDLVAVAVNGVIGAGIFGLPSKVFALSGPYSLVAFVACAFCVSAIVLCFAEVASRFESTGGPYLYARTTFGPVAGFTTGWLVWVARITALSANVTLLPAYLGLFFPSLTAGLPRATLVTAVVLLLALINVAGVKQVARFSNVFVIGKLLALAAFVVVGFFFLDPARLSLGALPAYRPFSQSVLLLIYAFTGFEMAVIPAGEARNPGRDIPAAILRGMVVVILIYVAIQVVCIGTLPGLATSTRPLADAAAGFMGRGGAAVITIGIVVSLAGNLNVLMLAASRVMYAMGEGRDLPAPLGIVHPRFHTPIVSVLVTAAVMLGLTLSGTFVYLVTVSTLARLGFYLATCAALPVLRRKPDAPKAQFLLPAGTAVSIAAMALGAWLLSNSTATEARDTLIAVAAGLVIFLLTKLVRRGSPSS